MKLAFISPKILVFCLFVFVAQSQAISVGDTAPEIVIQSSHGQLFRLSDFKGKKPVYLIFWNTWCPFCIKKMPIYQEVYNFYGDEIEVLAINTSNKDSYKKMVDFVKRHQIDFPTAYDFGRKISHQYAVTNTPTVFIIDINGVVRLRNQVPDEIGDQLDVWSLSLEKD